jgi:hypothetical protein
MQRSRLWLVLLALLVIATGLFLRSSWFPQGFFSKYAGDALWALVAFLGFGFLFPTWGTGTIAILAAGFSIAIEFSQLYHVPWLDAIRATLPGHLILGTDFAWADMLAYLVGIALGVLGEIIWQRLSHGGT